MASAVFFPPESADVCLHRPRILVVADHYYPGYKGGGPIRTLENLVAHLGAQFDFTIVTGDRDLGDQQPYPGVPLDQWVQTPRGTVYYAPRQQQTAADWQRRLCEWDYDAVYLNSLFSPASIRILVLRRLGAIPERPLLLAPRGELSPGALELKWLKKAAFLRAACRAGLFRDITWQATTGYEREDIERALAPLSGLGPLTVRTASNIPSNGPMHARLASREPRRQGARRKVPGTLRCAFVSRISRKKNLDFALGVLGGVRGTIELDVFGPIEDPRHWSACQRVMVDLPATVRVVYRGELRGSLEVIAQLAERHALVAPSRSENFGHVILESLVAGCPVVASDQTPWRGLAAVRAGWDLPLADPGAFTASVQRLVDMDQDEFTTWSAGAHALGLASVRDESAVEANRQLLQECAVAAKTRAGAAGSVRRLGQSMPAPLNPT